MDHFKGKIKPQKTASSYLQSLQVKIDIENLVNKFEIKLWPLTPPMVCVCVCVCVCVFKTVVLINSNKQMAVISQLVLLCTYALSKTVIS